MDWDIIPTILAFLFAIGLPLLLRARRKGQPQKTEELNRHLTEIGVSSSPLEPEDIEEAKLDLKRAWGEKVEGLIAVADKYIDYVGVVAASNPYGTNHYIEYLVRSPTSRVREDAGKTLMVKKRRPPLWGRVENVEWVGDDHLAQRLNFDYDLKYRLLSADTDALKGGISIIPEAKRGYTRIRTGYRLPSWEFFQAMDSVARHVKSWS